MAYQHQDDIDITGKVNLALLDRSLEVAVNRTCNAVLDSKTLDADLQAFIVSILKQFFSTHKSIRLLLKQKDTDIGMCGDAISLCREQVEKVFVLTLVIDDPAKWLSRWFKYDWRKRYEEFLLEKHECQKLSRFDSFLDNEGPEGLEQWKKQMGVSDAEKTTIEESFEFTLNNPDINLPAHLGNSLIPQVPTPGKAKQKINDVSVKAALERWYWEYKFLCDNTHIGPQRLIYTQIGSRQVSLSESHVNAMAERDFGKAVITSYVATLYSCSEAYRLISPNVEVIGELTKLWNELAKGTLLGKLFWEIRVKDIFPLV